jgi:hypothetical protein
MPNDVSEQGPRIRLLETDYVELWKYFETRGSELKGTMLQVLTLLIGFAAAILGFAVDKTLSFSQPPFVKDPLLLMILSLAGIAIAIYGEIVIREFAEHINRNFDRADYTRIGDRPLDEILAHSEAADFSKRKLPNICMTVRRITRSFGAAFVLGATIGLVRIVASW